MSQEQWTAVDDYFTRLIVDSDALLEAVLQESAAAGLPPISVTPSQGKLLSLLARAIGARHILEIGTLAGYSTIWLARSIPDGGRVVTLEVNPEHAALARANIARADLTDRVDVRVGPALETLPRLAGESPPPFDFAFIDADRVNVTEYFSWALKLSRPGSLIVVDNVVRKGAVVDAASEDPNIIGVRRFAEHLRAQKGVTATAVQTVGAKGYDGFAVVLVTGGDQNSPRQS